MIGACEGDAAEPPAIVDLVWLGARAARLLAGLHAEIGLTPRHLQTLFMLRAQGRQAQQDLPRRVGVDPTKLVGILNELEGQRLVRRVRDDDDRRRHHVSLTAAGGKRLDEIAARVDALDEALLVGLTEHQRTQLRELLRTNRQCNPADACDES